MRHPVQVSPRGVPKLPKLYGNLGNPDASAEVLERRARDALLKLKLGADEVTKAAGEDCALFLILGMMLSPVCREEAELKKTFETAIARVTELLVLVEDGEFKRFPYAEETEAALDAVVALADIAPLSLLSESLIRLREAGRSSLRLLVMARRQDMEIKKENASKA